MARKDDAKCELKKLLANHYDTENEVVRYDLFRKSIAVTWDMDETEKRITGVIPLFRDIIYRDNSYEQEIIGNSELKDCPVIAFHSYKGGVGRTLSLLAFAKAWSTARPSQKLLIIGLGMGKLCFLILLIIIILCSGKSSGRPVY